MIGKHIPTPQSGSSFDRLNTYILSDRDSHKVSYADCLNLTSIETATAEMQATAFQNRRSKDPVFHCLLSWRTGEQPTKEQVDAAVKITLEELNLSDCQTIYALHRNTENYHVHISVNRIDPETHKAIDPAHGWTIKAMERAARRIEHAQGWEIEKNAWSKIDENGLMEREKSLAESEDKIKQKAKDFENISGEKSAIRVAKETLIPAIKDIKNWDELNRFMRDKNMQYQKKGSGALIAVGDVWIKASSVSRNLTLLALEKRFGAYEMTDEKQPISNLKSSESQPLSDVNNTSPWREYAQLRREYYQTKKRVKDDLRTVQDTEKETLKNRQKEQRNELNSRGWNGRYKELNMARSVLAVTHQGERLNLKDKLQNQRKKFYKKYQKFPSYEEWLRGKDRHQDAEQWKYRAEFSTAFVGEISGIGEEKKERYRDIRGFVPSSFERGMVTFRSKYDSSKIAFVDVGKKINVLDHDESAMLAAMQLAVQKWGSIRLDGSDAYKQKSLELAVRNGIRVTNPELQELAAILKDRNERDQRDHGGGAMYDKKLDFEKYHAAVGADFYKVTATEIHEDGTKRGFMVNKRDGALDGFSADELEEKMWRLTSLERQGRNIYYTPVSESKHHILIDDMDGESLAQMIVDGYQPAAIIESSPGNFQAVITIPKLGTDVDRAVGNAIVAKLNKEYGDPDVSGEIHAHRAPGFTNQKPKHRRKDGSFPEIKLVKTEKVECEKTQKLAEEIYKGIQALQSEEKKRLEELEKTLPVAIRGKTDIFEAYSTHLKDILRIQEKSGMDRKAIDASRVDAMISVRLRATGHKREEVEKAVEAMAPKVREQIGSTGTHIWADYAKRTTDYAFGFSGDLALKKRQQFAEHWKTLELEAKRTRNRQSRSGGDLGR